MMPADFRREDLSMRLMRRYGERRVRLGGVLSAS
jgi:hypothetical protein